MYSTNLFKHSLFKNNGYYVWNYFHLMEKIDKVTGILCQKCSIDSVVTVYGMKDGSFKLWGLQLSSSEYKEVHITSMSKVMCKFMNSFSLTQYIVNSATFPSASNKCAVIDNSP